MQQDKIQAGMTTEPTISRLLKTGQARVLVDLRTLEKTKEALGGTYPAASLYMPTDWVEKNKPTVQKLANAFVKTLRFINTHSAAEIADKMPKDFYVGDKEGYVKALADGKGMFTARRRDAAGRPRDGAVGAVGVLEERQGQDRRPVEDLHDRVRQEGEISHEPPCPIRRTARRSS